MPNNSNNNKVKNNKALIGVLESHNIKNPILVKYLTNGRRMNIANGRVNVTRAAFGYTELATSIAAILRAREKAARELGNNVNLEILNNYIIKKNFLTQFIRKAANGTRAEGYGAASSLVPLGRIGNSYGNKLGLRLRTRNKMRERRGVNPTGRLGNM
jgi:hypothetical protein